VTILAIAFVLVVFFGFATMLFPARRRAFLTWIAGHRAGWIAFLVLAVFTTIFIGFARTSEPAGTDDGINLFTDIALPAAGILLIGFLVLSLSVNLAGFDPEADEFATAAAPGELGERLLLRWLQRVRWRRWVGGFVGMLSGLSIISLLETGDLGSGGFVYPGLLGLTLGSLSAELHHLRPRRKTTMIADLTVRSMADYTDPTDQKALAVCAAVALATFGYALSSSASVGWAIAAVGIVVAAVALQHRVALRRRPALTAELREADDLLRTIAVSRGIARPAIALSLATVGIALAPSSAVFAESVEAVVWIVALVFWWRNRGLGLKSIRVPTRANTSTTAPSPA